MPAAISSSTVAVVVGGGVEVRRRADAGPAFQLHRPPTGVPGVVPVVQRRVGGDRLHHRQPHPQVVADLHGQFPVGQPDVHVAAAHRRVVRHRPVPAGHRVVARLVGDRPVRLGHRGGADRHQPGPGRRGGLGGGAAQRHQVRAQLAEVGADRGDHLHHAVPELLAALVPGGAAQRGEHLVGHRQVPPAVRVEQQELLLDAEREGGQVGHGVGGRRTVRHGPSPSTAAAGASVSRPGPAANARSGASPGPPRGR